MASKTMAWLIGAKIACCGVLLLILAGVLSFAGIGAFLNGNALPLAGGGAVLALVFALRWLRGRAQAVPPPAEGAE